MVDSLSFPMKITKLKTVVVNAQMRNWVFVKVETDQPGLWGWGEASLEWKTRAVVGALEDFAPMIEGEDPSCIEHLYQKMYRQSFWRVGVIGMSAISGIDQALWDIRGKVLGQPVYQLLGGAVRDRVRMYTHLGGGDMKAVYETHHSPDPQAMVDLALEVVAKGYTAVKVLLTPPTEALALEYKVGSTADIVTSVQCIFFARGMFCKVHVCGCGGCVSAANLF